MKHSLIKSISSRRLLLIFAGWGMGPSVYESVAPSGYDVMVVYDYTSLHIDWSCVDNYSEICLLAWSLGVYAASQTTHAIDYKITRRVAVCGTTTPIDDLHGIPEQIFYGTLGNLDERSLAKFRRRMCATRDDFARFEAAAPHRPLEDVLPELQAISDSLLLNVPSTLRWDLAIVGRDDRIFPFANQMRAWHRAGVTVRVVASGHFPDFQSIVNENFIDKTTMIGRFARGVDTYDDNAPVQRQVIDDMMQMLRTSGHERTLRRYDGNVLEIGSGSGMLSRRIVEIAPEASVELWDIAAAPTGVAAGRVRFRQCDAEIVIRTLQSESVGYIFSSSTMQWFNSPERFIEECNRVLKPGGIALLSTFVRGNMEQVSHITGHSLPLPASDDLLDMARRHMTVVDCLARRRDLDFDTPGEVLRHMSLTGVNSLGGDNASAMARRLLREYPMMLDGRYHLTYCPMIIMLQKK